MDNDTKDLKTNDIDSKSKYKNKKILIFAIIIGIILCVVATLLVVKSLGKTDTDVMNFNEQGTANYKVYLKENEFYDEPYLESGMSYVATLINRIAIDFNYNFNMNQKNPVTFYYNIDAELKITDSSESNVLYSKIFDILDSQTISTPDASTFYINKGVEIDYNYYNEIAQNFKSKYGIDTVSALIVNFHVQKLSDVKYDDFDKEKVVSIKIPLTQKAVNVSLLSTDIDNEKEVVFESKLAIINKIPFAIGIVLYTAFLIVLSIIIKVIILIIPKKSKFNKNINKLLKTYDRLIVDVSTEPNFKDREIVKISDFDELIDIRDNLKLPIMYYKIKENKKCIFYIEHGEKENSNEEE